MVDLRGAKFGVWGIFVDGIAAGKVCGACIDGRVDRDASTDARHKDSCEYRAIEYFPFPLTTQYDAALHLPPAVVPAPVFFARKSSFDQAVELVVMV